jgi:hypothetical protein
LEPINLKWDVIWEIGRESQMGLIMNGLLKVPMQFFILLTGVMVFCFFQFNPVPLNFNPNNKAMIEKSAFGRIQCFGEKIRRFIRR